MNLSERRDFSTGPVARVSDQWRDGSLGAKCLWSEDRITGPGSVGASRLISLIRSSQFPSEHEMYRHSATNGTKSLAALPPDVRKASGFPAQVA
jgi:hypothetical protein